MGIIRRPDTVKLEDADTPVEEVVCIVENIDENTVEVICVPESLVVIKDEPVEEVKAELKPQTIISSNVNGMIFGTWIPSLTAGGTIDVAIRSAHYVKVGQLVTCTFDIIVTNMVGGRKDAEIVLAGLPNTSINAGYGAGSIHIGYYKNMSTEVSYISGIVGSNDTRAALWFQQHSEKSLKRLTQIDINVETVLAGTITYISSP